jgi:hypothetical protein
MPRFYTRDSRLLKKLKREEMMDLKPLVVIYTTINKTEAGA